jgi:hypothetical protein
MSNNKHGIIRLRRGTAAEWTASEPQPGGEVLRLGEPGYEKDTGKLKIGDGSTPWNSLAYFNAGATIDPEDIEDILGDGFLVAGTGININYNDLANSLTISTSGVSFDGHSHIISDVSGLQNALDGVNDVVEVADYGALLATVGTSGTIYVTLDTNKIYRYVSSPYSVQLGNDIDGQSAGDFSGASVSLNSNGTILAVGAPDNDDNGNDSGNVRVYVWNGNSWIQRGSDIDGEASYNYSGYSVALNNDGNILAIGAYGNNTNTGHVRVYSWNGTIWTQLGTDIDGEAIGDYSGISVNLNSDGDILAIGAYFNDGNGSNSGHVRVYSWNGSSWIQLGVDIDGEAADDLSGYSVSLSSDGNILAIGATRNDDNGSNSGHVRVYVWNGILWVQRGSDIDGEATNDFSGYSVSLNSNGNILAIGAIYNDGNGSNSGHVRVYAWNGSSWIQRGNDIDGEAANDTSGYSVSLNSDGNILAVGANGNDDNGADSGHVRVYYWDGSSWIQLASDIDGEAANDNSGISVSLNSDGNILAIGAIFNDGNTDYDSGHVRVYNLIGPYVELSRYPSEHVHVSTDITDFNSSVSGLLPVKDIIAGSGIAVSSTSGVYTINADVSGVILETIQDNLGSGFLVAGTGVQLTYNDAANTLTLDNLHTQINELSLEPQGFVNRVDSVITFDDSSRTFTIAPTGSSYDIYIEGVKVTKTLGESIVIGSGTALNYLHFDTSTGLLSNKTTGFNFDTDVPIAYIHWNSDINQSTFFGEERHGIRMDSSTHKWIHNTFGMQYIDGLSIGGYTLLGNGSSNSHAQIDISDGTLYQEDIIINITNGTGAGAFIQQLNPIAYIPVYYHLGSTGQWVRDVATTYPLKYNGTRALYNLYSGGTWTTPNVTNNRYFAMWIVGTNDINDPILAIMGQREDSSLQSAENNNNWSDINLTNIPTNELRPLYRLIFVTNDTFTNTPKSSLQSILDLRKSIITATYGVSQNDHGNLFGLGDDDHYQYIHINEARSIDAVHTFTNGLTISSGLLSAASGSFTSLNVNGTGVSLNGHTHTSSNITDFNSSVSGLLPSISGSGYVTTSFVNNIYTISVTGLQPSGSYANSIHNHISADITDFSNSVSGLLPVKDIVSGSGILVSTNSGIYTIASSGGIIITNYTDNRVLTSTGTSNEINAETNLTFDGTILAVSGIIDIDNLRLDGNTISSQNSNGNIIIQPSGIGSIQRDSGGNVRGEYANDWQTVRSTGTMVAKGDYSVICGGANNISDGSYSFIGGGDDNETTSNYNVVVGGINNYAGGTYTVIGGGEQNSANSSANTIAGGSSNIVEDYSPYSSIGGGQSNYIHWYASHNTIGGGYQNESYNSNYATIPGGFNGKTSHYGALCHAAGKFAANGDAQHMILVARRSTNTNTPALLYLDGSLRPITVPPKTTWTFEIKVSAYNDTDNEGGWWIFRGGIRRNASAQTSLIGGLITESFAESSLSSANITVVANDTTETLDINVTGISGKTIRWVAVIDISQVSTGSP